MDGVFEYGFQDGTGHRPGWLERPAMLWLAHHLGFPNWTAESIRTRPTTHILEWVEQNHLAADKTYMVELMEGGTRAVGDQVPGYRHEDLSVFSPIEWQQARDRLTFAAWTEAARAASQ